MPTLLLYIQFLTKALYVPLSRIMKEFIRVKRTLNCSSTTIAENQALGIISPASGEAKVVFV